MTLAQIALLAVILIFHALRRSLLSSLAVCVACAFVGFNIDPLLSTSERGWSIAVVFVLMLVGLWGIAEAREVA